MPRKTSPAARDKEPPTVLQAVNKLKAEQERILEEHKRFHVIRRRLEREQAAERNKARQEQFWQSVRESAAREEEEYRQLEQQQMQETQVRHSSNLHARQVQKRTLEEVRRSYRQNNHELYERIRQRQQQNEQIISSERTQLRQSRMASRLSVHQAEEERRRTIQGFYEARSK